jgi:hypothetical protein
LHLKRFVGNQDGKVALGIDTLIHSDRSAYPFRRLGQAVEGDAPAPTLSLLDCKQNYNLSTDLVLILVLRLPRSQVWTRLKPLEETPQPLCLACQIASNLGLVQESYAHFVSPLAGLDTLLEKTPQPLVAQQAARLAHIRKRVTSLASTLKVIQGRIDSMNWALDRKSKALMVRFLSVGLFSTEWVRGHRLSHY